MITLKIKKLSDTAIIPTYGSENAACFDLYANEDCIIPPHENKKIGTGLAMQVYSYRGKGSYVGLIYPRSGLSTKQGLRLANSVGVVDCDYTGEIIVALYNDSDSHQIVHSGDRIAQMMWMPMEQCNFAEVEELNGTSRGNGGFGSTGK